MKLIKLNKRKNHNNLYVKVDDNDYDYLNQWNWYVHKRRTKIYAARTIWVKESNGTKKSHTISMHRVILNLTNSEQLVDHKDLDGLNNQRSNLRLCTVSQNNANKVSRAGSTSRYIGVYFSAKDKLWIAQVRKDRKSYRVGCFKHEQDAAKAYNTKALELHGEFARLNVIQ